MKKLFALIAASIFFISCSTDVKDLNLVISKSNTQLIITNKSNEIYNNCIIKINDKFRNKITKLIPDETVKLGFLTFADDEGARFNPWTHKILDITVIADLKNDKMGYYSGSFN